LTLRSTGEALAASSSDVPGDLEEIHGAFGPPSGPKSNSKHQETFTADVSTPAQPWAYGAKFPLRTPNLKGPLWIRIRASVRGGPVGFGILNQDGSDFLSRTSVVASSDTTVTLHVPNPQQIGELVIQSWENGEAGDVAVDAITVLKPHSAIAEHPLKPEMLSSTVCRYEHWSTDWFKSWSERLGCPSSPTGAQIQRKIWEFCAIGRAFEERGMLHPGKSGLCFAAGCEFLPSAFAAFGCDILATDLATDQGKWETQHAASRSALFYEGIITRKDFDKHVTFRHVDMRDIHDIEPDRYDFLWSSCSFEHLGSLDAGLDFVTNAMKLLRRGGVAIHTTEFNLSSNDETITSGDNVVYRRRDIEGLDRRLRKLRCGLEAVDFDGGVHQFDLDYDSVPFMAQGKPHIKLELGGFVSTSILLIIHKA
jgi:hypothetical protein